MELRELGLTDYETKVYKTLLALGAIGAADLSRHSKVPYGRVYDVLRSLTDKGLVEIIPEKTKKFAPSSPEALGALFLKRKEELANEEKALLEEIKKLKPIYELGEKERIIVMAEGKNNFYRLERELPRAKKYEYDIKYTAEYRPVWARELRELEKKGVEVRQLVRYDDETRKNVKKWLKISKNIRKIQNEGVAASIIDDEAILITMIKSNTSLMIKDAAFVKFMGVLFKAYYEKSKSP